MGDGNINTIIITTITIVIGLIYYTYKFNRFLKEVYKILNMNTNLKDLLKQNQNIVVSK